MQYRFYLNFLKGALILFTLHQSAHADVLKNMQSFYSSFGASTNSTEASAYHDQSGGYLTGGSLFIRNPVRNQRLGNITPPGFRVGCGGIDIWGGGMGFINADQLKEMMKSIVGGLPSYAFMLAVETYAPQIHTIMQQLNKLAADFNKMNINSCEASAAIVGSMWPKSDLGSQATCRMLATQSGAMSDWAAGRHGCGDNPHGVLDRETGKNPDALVGEFNLAWRVLTKINLDFENNGTNLNPFGDAAEGLSGSEKRTLKEIMMTLSGTVIHKKHDKSFQKVTLPGKGDAEAFLTALMRGGKITYYKCDEGTKCLKPTETTLVLSENQALYAKIRTILEGLVTKIQADRGDQVATDGEMALINATTLPVYKIINVTTAYQKGRAPINIGEYAEIIAFDVVYKYVNDVFDAFHDGIHQLRALQFTDEQIQPFLEGMQNSRKTLFQHRQSVFAKMDMMLGFMQKTQMIEKQIHHMMGGLSNEYGA
jgi:conjugative transfer pilus assembly protein TraH